MEKTVTTRDGRWFSVRIMPYRTQDNRIDGLVLTFTETTTAKHLERDLRATAVQFQALLDHLAAGYVLCTTIPGPGGETVDGRVLQANRAFARMLPAAAAAPEGRTLLELLPALKPVLGAALAGTSPTGEPHVFERYLKAGAASFEVTSYRPTPDQFVCTFRDSTESGRLFEAPGGGSVHEEP
jgi:two-component system CheB/CheR fusion protein